MLISQGSVGEMLLCHSESVGLCVLLRTMFFAELIELLLQKFPLWPPFIGLLAMPRFSRIRRCSLAMQRPCQAHRISVLLEALPPSSGCSSAMRIQGWRKHSASRRRSCWGTRCSPFSTGLLFVLLWGALFDRQADTQALSQLLSVGLCMCSGGRRGSPPPTHTHTCGLRQLG